MTTTNENLSAPITGQFRSSPFYVAVGAPVLCVAANILAAWVCYRILPEQVARDQMALINPVLLGSGAGGMLLGVGGMVKRGLDITKGKIQAQLPQKLPETVSAGGDVTLATPQGATVTPAATGSRVLTFDVPPLPKPISDDFYEEMGAEDLQAQALEQQEMKYADH